MRLPSGMFFNFFLERQHSDANNYCRRKRAAGCYSRVVNSSRPPSFLSFSPLGISSVPFSSADPLEIKVYIVSDRSGTRNAKLNRFFVVTCQTWLAVDEGFHCRFNETWIPRKNSDFLDKPKLAFVPSSVKNT